MIAYCIKETTYGNEFVFLEGVIFIGDLVKYFAFAWAMVVYFDEFFDEELWDVFSNICLEDSSLIWFY